MAQEYDATEFVDADFQAAKKAAFSPASAHCAAQHRAPTREEVDEKVSEAQQKLAELKRAQEELERQRAALEETRRRQMEFQMGREEMVQHLTRGLGLLEEAEFAARRDAEQMAKAIADLKDALGKLQSIREESWTQESFSTELTRALTTVENARMEWNGARLKFPALSGRPQGDDAEKAGAADPKLLLGARSFVELCKLGLALTWPLAVIALLALGILVFVLLRQ